MENPNNPLHIRTPRTTSNSHAHAHTTISFPDTGDGGSSKNGTSVANGGQGGNVLFVTNNVCESSLLRIMSQFIFKLQGAYSECLAYLRSERRRTNR
jgi:hypothetical protein